MSAPAAEPDPVRWVRWAPPAFLAALFVGLFAWSFRKWADVHIDFGSELYIAWQLSEGQALYRDIAHRNGPLAHQWNAWLFQLFGVSVWTLVAGNLLVLAGVTTALWRWFARACDRLTATVCASVLLVVFAFGQYSAIGNFNWITPYHHAQTYGLALSLALLAALEVAARSGSRRVWALAGAALAAVFLTKAELFVPALAMTCAVGFAAVRGWLDRPPGAREGLAFAAGAAWVLGFFFAWLAWRMPVGDALLGLVGNWAHLGGVGEDAFYQRGAGLDRPIANGLRVLAVAAVWGAGAWGVVALDRLAGELGRRRIFAIVAGAGLCAALIALSVRWWELAAALPVLSLGLAIAGARWLARADAEARRRALPLWWLSVLATALLAKQGLAARFDHYGFVLAMPATLLAVAALVYAVPRRWAHGAVARALALAIVAAACVGFLRVSERVYATRTLEVGPPGERMLGHAPKTSPRARYLEETRRFLSARLGPGDTLLVLPEGVQLNYSLRVRNPTRFQLFLPTEIAAFGEATMLADLEASAPDWIVFVHRGWEEFGVGPFGRDPRNGRALAAWVDTHYRPVQRFGAEPFAGPAFGTLVLERVASEAR